jgi:hypothetical protein
MDFIKTGLTFWFERINSRLGKGLSGKPEKPSLESSSR